MVTLEIKPQGLIFTIYQFQAKIYLCKRNEYFGVFAAKDYELQPNSLVLHFL